MAARRRLSCRGVRRFATRSCRQPAALRCPGVEDLSFARARVWQRATFRRTRPRGVEGRRRLQPSLGARRLAREKTDPPHSSKQAFPGIREMGPRGPVFWSRTAPGHLVELRPFLAGFQSDLGRAKDALSPTLYRVQGLGFRVMV